MADFVQKTSRAPARALGLFDKGHLGPGADADITVLDIERGAPCMSLVAGAFIMRDSTVLGRGSRLVTTPLGVQAAKEAGIPGPVVPLGTMLRSEMVREHS